MLKLCCDCNIEKAESEFYFNKRFDYRYSRCKVCQRRVCRNRYAANREQRYKVIQQYFSTDRGKAVWRKAAKQSRNNHPERWTARTMVRLAVKQGKLKKDPCIVCGESKSEGHHFLGYDHPLDVKWLCRMHHRETEKLNNPRP